MVFRVQIEQKHHMARGLVLACLMLVSSQSPSAAATVIEFWAMGREGEVVQRFVPEFERRVPNVHVRVQQIPWSAAHEKLLTAYVGDTMPDVFQIGNTWIPEFVALDALEPLDGRVSSSRSVAVDDYFTGILETNRMENDGSLYGIPWYVDTRLLFYRTDMVQAAGDAHPPATWSAWRDVMARVQHGAGTPRYAILLPMTEWQPAVILALQLDAALLRDHDQYGNFRSPEFRRAFAFYLDLFHRGLAPCSGEAQVANLYQDFANGYFSFFISGPWNIGEFERRLPAALDGRWSTAPLPAPDERAHAGEPGVSLAGGASMAIMRRSAHRDAAWKWIEFLSEPAQQVALHALTGDLPARQSAWRDPALAGDPYARAFWTQLQHVRATPKIPEWERIATAIAQYAESAIRGTMTEEAALAALDHDTDALLEKRRWLLQRPHHGDATSEPGP